MEKEPTKRKRIFSSISIACLLIGLILARSVALKLNQGESLDGYSSLGISVSFLVALLLSGLITGQIGLIRGEKPMFLSLFALILNSIIFIALIIHLPR